VSLSLDPRGDFVAIVAPESVSDERPLTLNQIDGASRNPTQNHAPLSALSAYDAWIIGMLVFPRSALCWRSWFLMS